MTLKNLIKSCKFLYNGTNIRIGCNVTRAYPIVQKLMRNVLWASQNIARKFQYNRVQPGQVAANANHCAIYKQIRGLLCKSL